MNTPNVQVCIDAILALLPNPTSPEDLSNLNLALDAVKVEIRARARERRRLIDIESQQLAMVLDDAPAPSPQQRKTDRSANEASVLDYLRELPADAPASARTSQAIGEQTKLGALVLPTVQRLRAAGFVLCSSRGRGATWTLAPAPPPPPQEPPS